MSTPTRIVLLTEDNRLAASVLRVVRESGEPFHVEHSRDAQAALALLTGWRAVVLLADRKTFTPRMATAVRATPGRRRVLLIGRHDRRDDDPPPADAWLTRAEATSPRLLAHLHTQAAVAPTPRATTPPSLRTDGALFDAIPALLDVRDADGRFVLVNAARAAVHACAPEELHGRRIDSFLRGNRLRRERRRHADALEASLPPYEEEIVCADGRRRMLLETKAPLRIGAGAARHVVTVAFDISDRPGYERRFRHLVEGSPQGVLVECDRRPVYANQALARMLGYESPAELLACGDVEQLVAPHERERLLDHARARARGEPAPTVYEFDARHKDGHVVPVQNHLRSIVWHGQPATQSTLVDVTRRRHAESELELSRERLQQLYDDNPSMFLTLAGNLEILSANRFGAQQLGYEVEELLGQPATLVFDDEPAADLQRFVATCLATGEQVHRREARIRQHDGGTMWVRVSARAGKQPDGQPMVLVVCEDITEAHSLSEQLSFQATHDSLTGLANRHELEKRLTRVIDSARAEHTEHALCYLDLDQFKVINDTCGHSAGDELLRQLANVLPRRVRKRDTLARLGGDEFGVLMEHCSLAQAKRIANGLRRTIAEHRFMWEGNSFAVGVSIGVVPIDDASEGVTGVLAAADAACYAAKDGGRNRVHVYHADDAELALRHGEMQWVSRLNTALDEGRFTLCFQPIERLQAGAETGLHYELLLRLKEDGGQVAPPGAFLPAAERYGLSPRTDRWVVDTALRWLECHPAHVRRLALCSINVSGASLGDEGFVTFLLARLESGRVPCDRICFEITETAAIANLSAAIRFIGMVRDLGCRFALDDFGSGVSSFAYLKSLPVDFLKIDGVFVKDLLEDPIDRAMVRAINDMGHAMGKSTIAEFVENDGIREILRDIGVDFAQGFGVGRPRPIEELE